MDYPEQRENEVNLCVSNHFSEADWSVEQQAGCGVGQGKVLDQELLENRLVLQHTGQCEACIQHTHKHHNNTYNDLKFIFLLERGYFIH